MLNSNLRSLPQANVQTETIFGNPNQIKKLARKEISLKYSSEKLGFLHSTLIQIGNDYYLLAGPSQIGKTTYNREIGNEIKTHVFANDWVAIEEEDGNYYASDLNFEDRLISTDRKLITGVIFLTNNDELSRDAFVPNENEFSKLLAETFDTASNRELEKLSLFWKENWQKIPFLCAVPARRGDIKFTKDTLVNIIARNRDTNKPVNVGVIGTGSVGAEIAFRLGQIANINNIYLLNRDQKKSIGLALDMNHAFQDHTYIAESTPENIFTNCSSVFFTFRTDQQLKEITYLPERWQKMVAHFETLNGYAKIIGSNQFKGTLFMVTNPVDILTYALWHYSKQTPNQLRTYQVFGVGLELDIARILSYSKLRGINIKPKDILLFGNHSDDIFIKTNLPHEINESLANSVKNASKEVRNFVPRTIYGPAEAGIRTFTKFLNGGSTFITAIQENAYIGRKVEFTRKLPRLPEIIDNENYGKIIVRNQDFIKTYLEN